MKKEYFTKESGNFEAGIFVTGLVIAGIFLFWIGLSVLWIPGQTHLILGVTGAHILAGRVASIYLGLTTGLSLDVVFGVNLVVDTLWVMLIYPIVIFTMERLMSFGWIEKGVQKIVNAAERRRALIERFGLLGLFVFVACPLPMTGPIVGGVIGKLIGLANWKNMVMILGAVYTSLTVWVIILAGVHHQIRDYGPEAGIGVFLLLVLIGLAGRLYFKKKEIKA